ncbi:hypothetical protein J9317_17780 [Metabacillus sp. KIGAM252]|uniref:Uncharacterized protein n=1 Tax=Metabacillus flavus TaxID=2823519 RepID=A0ABS5LJ71_9BACI|nr:hypothetical protein [Metabacillus flavus]MBS2970598.1 hypothetical protein [Metabacillus flavus]
MFLDLDFLNDMSHLILLVTLVVSAGGTLALAYVSGKSVKMDMSIKRNWQPDISAPKPCRYFIGGMDQLHTWIIRIMKMASSPDDDGDRHPFSYDTQAIKIRGGHLCQTIHLCSRSLNGQVYYF